jgi:DNA-binding NarL/FixJ family response regulator
MARDPLTSRPSTGRHRSIGGAALIRATPVTVSLVNDYEIILHGLHAMLEPFTDRVRVVSHDVGGTPERSADIALFDTFGGRRDAIERAADMVSERRVGHVVLYTWDAAAAFVEQACDIGVSAIVPKSVAGPALVEVLERVAEGEQYGLHRHRHKCLGGPPEQLSAREREVLALIARGCSNRVIADELYLSIDTVKTYVRRLFHKLGVRNRTQAAMLATDHGVGPPYGALRSDVN